MVSRRGWNVESVENTSLKNRKKSRRPVTKLTSTSPASSDTGFVDSLNKSNMEHCREPPKCDGQEKDIDAIFFTALFSERLLSSSYLVHDLQHVLRHVRQPDGQDGHCLREVDVAHLTPALQKHVAGSSAWATHSGPSGRAQAVQAEQPPIRVPVVLIVEVCG